MLVPPAPDKRDTPQNYKPNGSSAVPFSHIHSACRKLQNTNMRYEMFVCLNHTQLHQKNSRGSTLKYVMVASCCIHSNCNVIL